MHQIPDELKHGPFTRERAEELGVTSRVLQGQRFERIHEGVWRHRDHPMTREDWIRAATLALPDDAHLTDITRLQQLGLDVGPPTPLHFVVGRDLHLTLDGVFLHRTKRLPPTEDDGVIVPAAFVGYCTRARVIDAIKVGDWLLHNRHTTIDAIRAFALANLWRDGAHEAVWTLDHLEARSRSLKESECRSVLEFASLPAPEVNGAVDVGEDVEVIGDLVYRRWRVVVEYEGAQHQEDRRQYVADVERYELFRGGDVAYVQVTKERLAHPQTLVGIVYRALLDRGYDGPPPELGERWRLLFRPVSVAVGPRRGRRRASGE